jgi:MoaA/NifB/PqqE/SkfB family radical SAM enzyme
MKPFQNLFILLNRFRSIAFSAQQFLRVSTSKKLWNVMLVKSQRMLKSPVCGGRPYQYFIDIINICNLRCPQCPNGQGILGRPPGLMTRDQYRQIIDEIAPYAYRVELYNWGEPLLHPEVVDFIRYARQRRIIVGISSNLHRLDARLSRELIESGLNRLLVSIDGVTQETYQKYRRGGNLELVLGNLHRFIELRKTFNRKEPFITWRFLVSRFNQGEIEAARKMARALGVNRFVTSPLYLNTLESDSAREWIPSDPGHTVYGNALVNRWHCHDLWETLVVNWDGGVSPCCWIHRATHDLGNVLVQPFPSVWNSSFFQSARRAVAGRKKKGMEPKTICHACLGHPRYLID